MREKIIVALSFTFMLLFPGLLFADCTDYSRSTSWAVEGDQKIIYYREQTPFATITLED
jgi:hypothetical protein